MSASIDDTSHGQGDLYFRQQLVGDMQNFAYLVGSRSARQCLVVDPAWNVDGLTVPVFEIVVDGDVVTARDQTSDAMTADVSGTAGDEDSHVVDPGSLAILADGGARAPPESLHDAE